ncbi:MAG: NAD(P)H-hydrate dehydratase [Eubacteriales bacterium]|nr:NAD(P)H-hydrate dehydratase [Eubacteriales bacterium]
MTVSYDIEDLYQKLPKRREDSHKGTYGKVLVIAGSRNMCGAAYLSAKAAYRTGAGLVYIYTEECNRVILQQLLPEAVLYTYEEDTWEPEAMLRLLADKDAVIIGPGFGRSLLKKRMLEIVLEYPQTARILDADALNLLAETPKLWEQKKGELIITPHLKEMERISESSVKEIAADMEKSAKEFSGKYQVITVLKNARTIVSDGKNCYRNTSGNHGMATGGSGDVLSGVIGALLAQGMTLFEAAKLGVYIHGLAGDAARDARGAYSVMASDIVDYILRGIS